MPICAGSSQFQC
uniref:Putative pectin methyltransferase QUA2 n=1 Tax=Rhizophora mucronata TaxID=61149 RepID=A0A2P2NIN0_RHIMU